MGQLVECRNCGRPFERETSSGRPQVQCSAECRRAFRGKPKDARRADCAECGGLIVQPKRGAPRKFCSQKCNQRASNRRSRRARLPLTDPAPGQRECVQCGKMFTPKRRDSTYCYDGWCVQRAYQQRRTQGEPMRMIERSLHCDGCGSAFTARHPRARWCSGACRGRHWQLVKSRQRRQLTGAPYTDLEIFERDGWRCHLCRKKVKKNVSRTHPDGATIDHLVPISEGGADGPANVATAHWRCNHEKRVGVKNEQLALI